MRARELVALRVPYPVHSTDRRVPPQLTHDQALAGDLTFEGEPRHVTLSLDHDHAAARALCNMARLSCKSEVTCECPVTCELRWMHLFVDAIKNIEDLSRTG